MSRFFKLLSIAIHSIVIALVVVVQIFSVGPLPIPREALAFNERIVSIADVPLPPPPRRPASEPARSVDRIPAPIDAPVGVTPETGKERPTSAPIDSSVVTGVEGDRDGVGFGTIPGTTPPPPPPPPPPQQPIHLHQGIQAPRKIVDVQPIYPLAARLARKEGVVILETVIDTKGTVESVRVLRGDPFLDDAAVSAVRQWRFTPALLNGQPVPVVMTVTVNFQLQ